MLMKSRNRIIPCEKIRRDRDDSRQVSVNKGLTRLNMKKSRVRGREVRPVGICVLTEKAP